MSESNIIVEETKNETVSQSSQPPISEPPKSEQVVTPWAANCGAGGFDYEKLIEQFGVQPITKELIDRFEAVTGHKAHAWLRRGIFFAHRQLEEVLDHFEAKKPIFLYTGRGPTTEALHLGHLVPFIFTKWLQDVFDAVLVIQMADDEKFYFKDHLTFEEIYRLGFENAKDIIACGFNPEKTFIFSNHDYSKEKCVQDLMFRMKKDVRIKDLMSIFGLDDVCSVGQFEWPLFQSAAAFPAFYESIFKNTDALCLVPYAVDQDPYFRLARDIATKYGYRKPCSIMTQFLPALEGNAKMNSTNTANTVNKTIFMTDDPESISDTIKRYAFSGGRQTKEEHQRLGADLSVDIPYKYLRYFLNDDEELARIGTEYSQGRMMTSEIKGIITNILVTLIKEHQTKRAEVTPQMVARFYDITKFQNNA
jgi:tryptophanyl-tRNA synthetase